MYSSRSLTLLSIVLFSAAAGTSVHTIDITNGKQLKEYLCSPKRTIAPNTHLSIKNYIDIGIITNDCLVENTSNIVITSPRCDRNVAVVGCSDYEDNTTTNTFSFFNVTNLTISCVEFDGCGSKPLPPADTKYINESDQVFEYDTTWTTLFFNHCYNVTLYNVFTEHLRHKSYNKISIVGVNLCGHSNITSILISTHTNLPSITLSVYYVDSSIISEDAECTLHIQSNTLSTNKRANILQFLEQQAERFPVVPYRDLAVIAAQEKFKVDIDMKILPMSYSVHYCTMSFRSCSASVLIMFINNENYTHVTFQGYPYEFCTDPSSALHLPHSLRPQYRPIQLDVIFYSTPSQRPSGEGISSPLLIQNTAFVYYDGLRLRYSVY